MAPSTSNNSKRPRPAFNPPRPQSKANGISKSTNKSKSKSNIGSIFADSGKPKYKSKSQAAAKLRSKNSTTTPATSRRAGVREQEPEDDSVDDEKESMLDDEAEAEDDAEDAEEEEGNDREGTEDTDADMMLAEITHSPTQSPGSSEPCIPIPLLHRLLYHNFQHPDITKLSTDARACMGKYVETFIREGIARCAFEMGEKAGIGSDSGLGGGAPAGDGWLEVEDLERVGGQLVLDF